MPRCRRLLAGESVPDRHAVGFPAPFLRRDPLLAARCGHRIRTRDHAGDELGRAGDKSRADRGPGGAPMVKNVVGAHYGLRDWLVQRVTAVLMAVYTVVFAGILLISPPQHYGEWRALFENQSMRIVTFLFFLSLFWHSWIGVRGILMDYIKPTSVRLGLEVLAAALLVGYAGWAIQILWSL